MLVNNLKIPDDIEITTLYLSDDIFTNQYNWNTVSFKHHPVMTCSMCLVPPLVLGVAYLKIEEFIVKKRGFISTRLMCTFKTKVAVGLPCSTP